MRAMTSRVEIVHLGGMDGVNKTTVTLDFDTLTEYKGDGICREVHCNHMCIGWHTDDDEDFEFEDDEEKLITDEDCLVVGGKDKWMDDESAATWAKQMNWDLQLKNEHCEYILSRKKA